MRVSEIIRQVLDVIDSIENEQPEQPIEDMGYKEDDIKRFKQIAGLTTDKQYSTTPNEQYADMDAVTVDAGADGGVTGTKDPADIRGEHPSLYPGTVYGAK